MGKVATLLMVMSCIILFSLVSLNMGISRKAATESATTHFEHTQARGIANSVADMVLAKVSDSADWRAESPQEMPFFEGTGEYTVKDTTISGEPLIRVVATGTLGDVSNTVILLARPANAVPPFFKYAVLSHYDLTENGLNNLFRDAYNTSWNANIHTNSKLILNVANYQLCGFATYTNSITANWAEVAITPNQNPAALPVHCQAPAVSIPVFNPDTYIAKATSIHGGDATYAGSIVLGTKANPAIIYVGGKLFISGMVSGYGVFIVKGDIELQGSLLLTSVDPQNSKIGLYTREKVLINHEYTTLHAQIFADNEVVVNAKNARIHGSITTRNKATFNAEGIHLYYKPALDALTKPFWSVPTLRLVALHRYE